MVNEVELELLLPKSKRRRFFSNFKFRKMIIQADNIMTVNIIILKNTIII